MKLLTEALRGAHDSGAEVEIIHYYGKYHTAAVHVEKNCSTMQSISLKIWNALTNWEKN